MFKMMMIVMFICVALSDFLNVLSVITLGGISSAGILCGGTVTVTLIGATVGTYLCTTVVWFVSGCMLLNSLPIYSWNVIGSLLSYPERVLCSGILDYVY